MALSSLRSSTSLGVGLFLALLAITSAGCNRAAAPKEVKLVDVTVTTPITDEVVEYQDFTGRLDAFKTVDIRARVSGYVTAIPFKEGDVVHEGDLLFQIDPLPYQADLNVAEANLKVMEADANLQNKNAARASQLIETHTISKEEYDTVEATYAKSRANVGAMQSARDKAKLYLDYTHVVAPLTGRISRRLVDPGNLVTADSTLLTTIVTQSPIFAYFDVDERTYLELKKSAATTTSTGFTPLLQSKVLMRLANEEKFERMGVVNFIDNRVIATSGTIRMRGIFENPKNDLTSGLFARVRMPYGKPYQALLVPDEALQSDQGKKYAFVVDGDSKIQRKDVELGQAIEGLRVIKKGLKKDDRVVITGMQRVRVEQSVTVTERKPPEKPDSPLGQIFKQQVPGARDQETGIGN